jgi:hypothetical protein
MSSCQIGFHRMLILGPNVPICTSLSDSALQFRPWLAIMQSD